MDPADWHSSSVRVLQMLRSGRSVDDADLLLVLNGSLADEMVTVPAGAGVRYTLVWDSAWEHPPADGAPLETVEPAATVTQAALTLRAYLAPR